MPEDPKKLRGDIAKEGFNWTVADDPPPAEELGRGLDVSDDEIKALKASIQDAISLESMGYSFAAPAAIDWRSNGGNWITPVKNQRSCGSCVSFACCATIEARVNIVCRNPNLNTDLSESHLFFCGCGPCCNSGWNFPPALNRCQNTGIGLESAWPYEPHNQDCRTIPIHLKINSWRTLNSIGERKSVIAESGPVVAGMEVFSDFMQYSGGVYRKTSGATSEGYHAISVVGYDDAQQCWICKNSWGTGWGESGFFRIGYGEVGIDSTFPFYHVEVPCTRPQPQPNDDPCREYVPFLIRVIEESRRNPRLRACLRYYICRTGGYVYCGAWERRIVRYVYQVLGRCPQYRRTFCRYIG